MILYFEIPHEEGNYARQRLHQQILQAIMIFACLLNPKFLFTILGASLTREAQIHLLFWWINLSINKR
jgi:hypothetical protein